MIKKSCLLFAASTLAAAITASAQDSSSTNLETMIMQQEGMTPISEGLYGKKVGASESYIAIGPVGQRALAQKVIEARDSMADRTRAHGGDPDRSDAIHALDKLIDSLSAPQPKNQDVYGDCLAGGGGNYLHAVATSTSGVVASATASNSNSSYYTTNVALAVTQDRNGNDTDYHSSTTHGTTTASASASAPNPPPQPCESTANATVTCPGGVSPAISAFAHSLVYFDCRN